MKKMNVINRLRNWARVFSDPWRRVWTDEGGWYYAEYTKDPEGKKRITVGETTLIILIVCITLLCLTILALSYKAGLLSQVITFFLIVAMLIFLSLVIVFGKIKTHAFNINGLLLLIVILCLLILGLNVRDIKDLFGGLFSKWNSTP